jgi:hypothetical protein
MGNGVLQRDSDLAVGAGVSAVTVADYNGDGLADLAVALPENAGVAVLYGTAAGTFLAPQYTSTAPGAGRLANGDLNADGLPDLVVGSATQGSVHVLLGSSGGLQSGATLFYSSGLHNLIVDDMNQDGISDILVMTENREVLISNGLGGGNFTPPELMLYYYSGTAQLSVGDLNGAGPDLVVLSSYVLSTFFEFRTANAAGYFTKVGEQQVEHEPRWTWNWWVMLFCRRLPNWIGASEALRAVHRRSLTSPSQRGVNGRAGRLQSLPAGPPESPPGCSDHREVG